MELKVNPFELQANPWNSNRVPRDKFEKLKLSLEKYGSFKPIIVREVGGELQVLGGFHRVEAAKELGWTEIPVWNLGEIPEDKAKEIGILDNTRYGEDDKELLDKILDELTDLEGFSSVIPEEEEVDLEIEDDFIRELEEEEKERAEEVEEDDTYKTLRFKLETDKAEEIEQVLKRIAEDNDYSFKDGYKDLSLALYHALVLEA